MSTTDPAAGETAPEPSADPAAAAAAAAGRRRVRRIGLFALLLVGLLLTLMVLFDRIAPGSSRGTVTANVVQIAPRVSGRVTEILVQDNAVVKEGAPLFALDSRPFELAVDTARVRLEQAGQGAQASSAQLAAAQAQVAQARAAADQARDTATRSRQLQERGIVAKARAEADAQNLAQAEAAVAAAEASAESVRRQMGETEADNTQVRAAELALEQAEYDLLSTTVRAPRFGVVTNLHLAPGQFIGAGNPALTFIDADAVWVTVDLRENQLINVKPGDPATLTFDALPGRIFRGQVESRAWGINPGRNEAGGLPVNTPVTQWFEPARKLPVRVVLDGGMEAWPREARMGGKVGVVIHTRGLGHPVSLAARGWQQVQAWLSVLY